MADSKKYNGSTWEHSLRKLTTATDTFTTLPVDIYADGNNATVGISGNTIQSGTPTPDNPVDVNGVGVRTENLYLKKIANATINSDGSITSNNAFDCYLAKVEANKQYIGTGFVYSFFVNEPFIGSGGSYDGQRVVAQALDGFTSPIDGYVAVRHNTGVTGAMLNEGSTALPYEPYGYKIPISSAGQTTPVYLGEVESTRIIRKYVFAGTEAINAQRFSFRNGTALLSYMFTDLESMIKRLSINNHFRQVDSNPQSLDYECAGFNHQATYSNYYYMRINLSTIGMTEENTDVEVVNAFRSYLAAQYAAGTPVCVWYVLATEETGIVNEPLMKIGDYADTVSGITVPTVTGKDTFDVETTLKPSEVSLSYTGWHDATVEEWDGSQWN